MRDLQERLTSQLRSLQRENETVQAELKDWMTTAENNALLVKTLEQKVKQLTLEKKDLEDIILK